MATSVINPGAMSAAMAKLKGLTGEIPITAVGASFGVGYNARIPRLMSHFRLLAELIGSAKGGYQGEAMFSNTANAYKDEYGRDEVLRNEDLPWGGNAPGSGGYPDRWFMGEAGISDWFYGGVGTSLPTGWGVTGVYGGIGGAPWKVTGGTSETGSMTFYSGKGRYLDFIYTAQDDSVGATMTATIDGVDYTINSGVAGLGDVMDYNTVYTVDTGVDTYHTVSMKLPAAQSGKQFRLEGVQARTGRDGVIWQNFCTSGAGISTWMPYLTTDQMVQSMIGAAPRHDGTTWQTPPLCFFDYGGNDFGTGAPATVDQTTFAGYHTTFMNAVKDLDVYWCLLIYPERKSDSVKAAADAYFRAGVDAAIAANPLHVFALDLTDLWGGTMATATSTGLFSGEHPTTAGQGAMAKEEARLLGLPASVTPAAVAPVTLAQVQAELDARGANGFATMNSRINDLWERGYAGTLTQADEGAGTPGETLVRTDGNVDTWNVEDDGYYRTRIKKA